MIATIVMKPLPLERGEFMIGADRGEDELLHACPRCAKTCLVRFGSRYEHRLMSRDPVWIGGGSLICPHGCGAQYFVTVGNIEWCSDAWPIQVGS
jgi:hypothetical protein